VAVHAAVAHEQADGGDEEESRDTRSNFGRHQCKEHRGETASTSIFLTAAMEGRKQEATYSSSIFYSLVADFEQREKLFGLWFGEVSSIGIDSCTSLSWPCLAPISCEVLGTQQQTDQLPPLYGTVAAQKDGRREMAGRVGFQGRV